MRSGSGYAEASGSLDTSRLQDGAEPLGKPRVAVGDQVPLAEQETIDAVRGVSSDLLHPTPEWLRDDAEDLDPAGRQFDCEEHVVGTSVRPDQIPTVSMSAAAMTSQWALRKVFHDMPPRLLGDGSIPCSQESGRPSYGQPDGQCWRAAPWIRV